MLRVLLAGLLLATRCALAGDAYADGRAHFAAGDFDAALKAFESAAAGLERVPPDLLHNQAAALFKLGRRDDARELWVRSLAGADALHEARTRFNLGNCDYADALAALGQSDPQAAAGAIEKLRRAVEQYRDAVRLDASLVNARANLELAQQLLQRARSSPQSQPSDAPDSQPSDSQDAESQPSSRPSSQPSSRSSQDESSESREQSSDTDQTQDDQQDPSESQEQQPEKSSDGESPESESDDSKPQSQEQNPASRPAETQPSPDEAQSQPASEDELPANLTLTRDEAERLLQRVRDFERRRREYLRRLEAARYKPVERDW